jgi:hypothetical protein
MVIRIDVHSTGKNSSNTTRTLPTLVHVRPMYAFCGRFPYVATFHTVINTFEQIHCTQEEGLPTQSTARRSSDPRVHTQLLSHNSQWSSGKKSSFCWQPTTRLTGLIPPTCDRYVQYLLTGTNTSVLNRHRRGLQPWRCWLSMYHSPTFPTSCLPFPLKAPPDLRLYIQHLPTELEREQALNLASVGLHSTSTVTYHLSIAWANDVPSR